MLLPNLVQNELARLVLMSDVPKVRGRPRKVSTVEVLQSIFYVCKTGCQWSAAKCPDGVSYKTIYHRFNVWSRRRVFEDCFYNLAKSYLRQRQLPLIADTSYVKNISGRGVLGRNHTDRGRMSTKVSILTDSKRIPLCLCFS